MLFRSIRSRLSLSFAGIALVATIVLGIVLLVILQKYYLSQEIKYLRGNAQAIAKVVNAMLSGNTPHEEVQSQIENLAFLSQTRVQIYDTQHQLLYDSGSPQDVSVNLDNLDSMAAAKENGNLRRLLIISVGPKQDKKSTAAAAATPLPHRTVYSSLDPARASRRLALLTALT